VATLSALKIAMGSSSQLLQAGAWWLTGMAARLFLSANTRVPAQAAQFYETALAALEGTPLCYVEYAAPTLLFVPAESARTVKN
jgi:hypothetical protein